MSHASTKRSVATCCDVAPPGITLNVSLEEFERAVYAREHEAASRLMLQALRRLKLGGEFIGYATDPRIKPALYTRFCAAVVSLLVDPAFSLSQEGVDHIASEHAILDVMFRGSAFETSDHMLALLSANPTEEDRTKLRLEDGSKFMKFMLTYSLRSAFAMNFEAVFAKAPNVMFSLWAGMVSPLLTTAVVAQERKDALLGLHGLFAGVQLSGAVLPTLSDAYMYTSYGLRPDKHDAKATIHALFARFLATGTRLPRARDMRRRRARALADGGRRPTLLVCCEWFHSVHAMYRCYAQAIRQLATRFRLIGASRARDIDEVGKAEFHDWIEVPDDMNLRILVDRVNACAPDVIYYPSLGMGVWWVALASARLAPVQVMTLGHPASSRSPCIDYVIVEDGSIGDQALFTEEPLTIPRGSCRFLMRSDAEFPIPLIEDHPETVHVAVPAMLCKLNARFMLVLREISLHAGRPVQFHFLINMVSANLYQASREIRQWLPSALVYERMGYNEYLSHLSRCHLHLCTFPFGGTNSNIDSMLLGIPVLTLEGQEPHERFDAMMVRRAGLDEFLVAQSLEEYEARAILLIRDDALRASYRDFLLAADLQGIFFGDPPDDTAFVGAMWQAYTKGGREHGARTDGG